LPRLQSYRGIDEAVDTWAARAIEGYDPASPALSYGPVMEAVFPHRDEKQKEVERICKGRDPGFGCCVLAKLIEAKAPDFNVVLTTNFDDLIADALYLFTASRPLVISHAALAQYMLADPDKALIAKLHGDYQLQPLNTEQELSKLNALVAERLRRLLQQRGLIVMGYGGNDKSVMGVLESLPPDALGPGIWWVARSEPNERVVNWLKARGGYWVQGSDFDQLMLLILKEFDLSHPEISRWEKVRSSYFEALDALGTDVSQLEKSEPAAAALKEASADAVARIETADWWAVELEARRFRRTDPEQADAIYRKGLERLPNSAELASNYAMFLMNTLKDYDRAEEVVGHAVDIAPTSASTLSAQAILLTKAHNRHDAAEELFKRALDADPESNFALSSFAMFSAGIRGDYDLAEMLFKRAIALQPTAYALGQYAGLLLDVRRDYARAEDYFQRSIASDASNAYILVRFAELLARFRDDEKRAQEFYERAIALEPDEVYPLYNYATFHSKVRRDFHQADALYEKALELNPDDPNLLVNYAQHLFWSDRAIDGTTYLDRAEAHIDDRLQTGYGGSLLAEIGFYRLAHGSADQRGEVLSRLKNDMLAGARSPSWDFSGDIERAAEQGHPEIEWLPTLASVIAGYLEISALDDWNAWKDA
jgi:tetratricopeptide (TPR) repeat protein